MKRREMLILSLAFIGLAQQVHAEDATPTSPTGTWKWSVTNPTTNKTRDQSFTLKLEGEKLSGSVAGPKGTEINIENATFKEGQVSFSVTRERNEKKITTKFSGKLDGDTITGTSEIEKTGKSREWVAKREKS